MMTADNHTLNPIPIYRSFKQFDIVIIKNPFHVIFTVTTLIIQRVAILSSKAKINSCSFTTYFSLVTHSFEMGLCSHAVEFPTD